MNNSLDDGLKDGVAIVTGGSRGIGRAIAELLAAAGMDVTFTYRDNANAANDVVEKNPGKKIAAEKVDVRDSAACAAFVEKIFDRAGKIDLLVNNAGVIRDNPLAALEDDDVRTVLETNVTGVFNMARAVVPYMVSKRRGKDREHQFRFRRERWARPDQLRRQQRRDQRIHQSAGRRTRAPQHHRQRRCAGCR